MLDTTPILQATANHYARKIAKLKKEIASMSIKYPTYKEGIQSVLTKKKKTFKAKGIAPVDVDKYMKTLGWKRGDMETNGWQYDYWIPYTKGELSYTLFGCGWEGTIEFYLTEE